MPNVEQLGTRVLVAAAGAVLVAGFLSLPVHTAAFAAGPAATGEPAPLPLVSRKLSLWGIYGYGDQRPGVF